MNTNVLKIAALAINGIGFVLTLANNAVCEKLLDDKIAKAVQKALEAKQ